MLLQRFCLIWVLACAVVMSHAAAPAKLDAIIEKFLADPALADARIGMMIQSLDDGSIWYARNAGDMFIPASAAKIVTTALALEYLGPEYRYSGAQIRFHMTAFARSIAGN